jgi:hypothetical protein
MATSVEEIGKKKNQVEIPPARRDYFTIPEFWKIRSLLPFSWKNVGSSCFTVRNLR